MTTPSTMAPETAAVLQGIVAGAERAGLRIAGCTRLREVRDPGPTVEIGVAIARDGRALPPAEARTDFTPAAALLIVRAMPGDTGGGWRAQARLIDVATGRETSSGSSTDAGAPGGSPDGVADAVARAVAGARAAGPPAIARPGRAADPPADLQADPPAAASDHRGTARGAALRRSPLGLAAAILVGALLVGSLAGRVLPGGTAGSDPARVRAAIGAVGDAAPPGDATPAGSATPSGGAPGAGTAASGFTGPAGRMIETLLLLGVPSGGALDLAAAMAPVESTPYRVSTDRDAPPTIDEPWATVEAFGAALVEFEGPVRLDGEPLRCAEPVGGRLAVCAGAPPRGDLVYVVFAARLGAPLPVDDGGGFEVNALWLTSTPGAPTWVPAPPHAPGDPWQGASRVPFLVLGAGGGTEWTLRTSEVRPDGTRGERSSEAFAILGGETLLLFAPATEILGDAAPDELRIGFALHVHDGDRGACETCASIVTTVPALPREALAPFDAGTVIRARRAPPARGGEIGSPVSATPGPGAASDARGGTATALGSPAERRPGGGTRWDWIAGGVIGGGAAALGATWLRRRRAHPAGPGGGTAHPGMEDGPPAAPARGGAGPSDGAGTG